MRQSGEGRRRPGTVDRVWLTTRKGEAVAVTVSKTR
jgi:hypothetical protein